VTREQAYDEHISPLMKKIIAMCKEHDIQLVAAFNLEDAADPASEGMLCRTVILPNATGDERLLRMRDIIFPPQPSPMYMTVRNGAGEATEMVAVLP